MSFSVILGAVQNFSQALTDKFLHEDAFDYQVIHHLLHVDLSCNGLNGIYLLASFLCWSTLLYSAFLPG